MDLREKRALYNGFGTTLTRAAEFVAAPLLFALIGRLIDDAASTAPLFTVALALFGLAGVFVRAYFAYDVAMKEQEKGAPWARGREVPGS